jgi:hypothetical protein
VTVANAVVLIQALLLFGASLVLTWIVVDLRRLGALMRDQYSRMVTSEFFSVGETKRRTDVRPSSPRPTRPLPKRERVLPGTPAEIRSGSALRARDSDPSGIDPA